MAGGVTFMVLVSANRAGSQAGWVRISRWQVGQNGSERNGAKLRSQSNLVANFVANLVDSNVMSPSYFDKVRDKVRDKGFPGSAA